MNFVAAQEAIMDAFISKLEERPVRKIIESLPTIDGGTVYLNGTFLTREESEDAQAEYLRAYHPCGYGTHFDPIKEVKGYFTVHGVRAGSCD